ncbi:salviol synthase-like [Andrographis paniculata]|uniref:salviol synthase-like n=1 Tax=Andrographis paniculata TaxID=175694 RepID=UPI0021E88B66|nr:salviol synthase-like [Andrographis paniculata]
MDFDPSFSFIAIFSFFLAVFFRLITRCVPVPDQNSNLPPGPRKLPLIGNLYQLIASSKLPHQLLTDLAEKYGPVMHLQLGEVNIVVISSPEAAKEVMKTHDVTFSNRPSLLVTDIILYKNSDIASAPYGEYWRQLRKFCAIELLSVKRVQSFRALREEEFLSLCGCIASNEGLSMNLTEKICLTTCNVVMQASIGKKGDELTEIISTSKESAELASGFYLADLYPSISLFRRISGAARKTERVHKKSDRIIQNIIDQRRESANGSKQQEDFADVLLKSRNELQLTNDNIKAVIQDIFGAGIETSSTTTDWAMAEMIRHPRVLKKAQEEVREVFKDKGFVEESRFEELKYLKSIIKETLRMHPPFPLLLPRENSEQCEIFGYKVPSKSRVMVNAWAIGRDPRYWKEPHSFIPERFLDNPVDYKANNFELLPFGGGRRICAGISFGLANVELPLAMFLYHFDWVLPDGMKPEDLDMSETSGITASRKYPLYVIPRVKITLPVKQD